MMWDDETEDLFLKAAAVYVRERNRRRGHTRDDGGAPRKETAARW
jgi:hypothetical protein